MLEVNKVNINQQTGSPQSSINSRGEHSYVQTQNSMDTVEIGTNKKAGVSTNTKIGIGLGIVGAIIGGILLRRNLTQGQQVTQNLSQAINNLITEGRLTTKEAELFDNLKNLEGDEFISKAYELIAKDLGLPKCPTLNISHDNPNVVLGHTGRDITIFPDNYPAQNKKAEILGTLRHELEHFKQSLIIFMKKGDKPYQEAFERQTTHRINAQVAMSDLETDDEALGAQIVEECRKYGFNNNIQSVVRDDETQLRIITENQDDIMFDDVLKTAFEHDTPIETIRSMTPCEFDKLHFTEEELAKADSYLEGIRKYVSTSWFPDRFVQNGIPNIPEFRSNTAASDLYLQLREGYYENIIEIEAITAGKGIRDKFIEFLRALNS